MAKVHTKKEAFRDSSCFMISCTIRSVKQNLPSNLSLIFFIFLSENL